jgi:hypothetical protein
MSVSETARVAIGEAQTAGEIAAAAASLIDDRRRLAQLSAESSFWHALADHLKKVGEVDAHLSTIDSPEARGARNILNMSSTELTLRFLRWEARRRG